MKECIDLHTHTLASDGRDTPRAVVSKAAWLGLSAIAITDHDTLDGLAEAQAQGREDGIEVIRGCELSVLSECGEVHILGLWIPEHAEELEEALKQLRYNRSQRNVIIVERLRELGLDIHYDDVLRMAKVSQKTSEVKISSTRKGRMAKAKLVQKVTALAKKVTAPFCRSCKEEQETVRNSVGRPHIAAVLLEKGYVSTIKEAFTKYLADGCPAYEPKKLFEVEEIFRLLNDVQATICLAHPGLIRCTPEWLDAYVGRLKELGLWGLEVYHSEHNEETTARMLTLAQKYDLVVSGGSDYHGTVKPTIHLGCGKGNLRIKKSLLDVIKECRRAKGCPV